MTDATLPGSAPPTAPPAATVPPRTGFFLGKLTRSYAFRSLISSLLTIWLAMTFTFFLIRLLPSNPVQLYIDELMQRNDLSYEEASARASAMFTTDVNAPPLQQYLNYVGNVLRGNLGESLRSPGTPVLSIIATFLPWTLFSVGLGLLISFVVGLALGMLTAYFRNSLFDTVITSVASFLSAIPNYLIAILIVVVAGTQLRLFSVGEMRGAYSLSVEPGFNAEFILSVLKHAILPVGTYFLSAFGRWMLIMKNSTLAVLGEEYVNAAVARGLRRGRVITAYVGRNASLPMVTHLALNLATAVGGSIVIETYFVYPGIGQRLVTSINERDYTVVQGVFLILTISVVAANFLTDFLYERLDPRVRLGGKAS
jgi:peptide/nickel transport system permease protein